MSKDLTNGKCKAMRISLIHKTPDYNYVCLHLINVEMRTGFGLKFNLFINVDTSDSIIEEIYRDTDIVLTNYEKCKELLDIYVI
tara:strand:- start:1105 stop:1356 length:252 start_codon:yes stop_codon:yes gene_type:complete